MTRHAGSEHPTDAGEPRDAGDPRDAGRRSALTRIGWGALSLLGVASVPALLRFLQPRGWRDGGAIVELGPLEDYRNGAVSTRWVQRHGLWLVGRGGRLVALEARCTHLGCTPRWTGEEGGFLCPCHGSRFTADGVPRNGPATQPLQRLAIRVERGEVVVDRSQRATLDRAERDRRFWVTL